MESFQKQFEIQVIGYKLHCITYLEKMPAVNFCTCWLSFAAGTLEKFQELKLSLFLRAANQEDSWCETVRL